MGKDPKKETVKGWCLECSNYRTFTKVTEGKKMTWICHTCGAEKVGYKKTRRRKEQVG
jgi:Zn finger protein HypA/HybF involved in hydrogenase expression